MWIRVRNFPGFQGRRSRLTKPCLVPEGLRLRGNEVPEVHGAPRPSYPQAEPRPGLVAEPKRLRSGWGWGKEAEERPLVVGTGVGGGKVPPSQAHSG